MRVVETADPSDPSPLTLNLLQRIEATWGKPECPTDWIKLPSQRRWEYETAVRLLDMPSGSRVLDAGGGGGYLSYILSDSHDVTFNDRHDCYKQPPAPVQKIIGSFFTLLATGRLFNAIVCVSVLEHVPSQRRVEWFSKVQQLLLPGGVAIFTFEWHPTKVFNIGDGYTVTTQQLAELYAATQLCVTTQLVSPIIAQNSQGWRPLAVRLVKE